MSTSRLEEVQKLDDLKKLQVTLNNKLNIDRLAFPDGPNYPGTDLEPEDSWSAITITVNGWNLVEKPVEL